MRERNNIKIWTGKIKNNKEIVLINMFGILYGILMAITLKMQEDILSYICQVIFLVLFGWLAILVLTYYTMLALEGVTKNVKNATIIGVVATICAITTYKLPGDALEVKTPLEKLILAIFVIIYSIYLTALLLNIIYHIINVRKWRKFCYDSKKR